MKRFQIEMLNHFNNWKLYQQPEQSVLLFALAARPIPAGDDWLRTWRSLMHLYHDENSFQTGWWRSQPKIINCRNNSDFNERPKGLKTRKHEIIHFCGECRELKSLSIIFCIFIEHPMLMVDNIKCIKSLWPYSLMVICKHLNSI